MRRFKFVLLLLLLLASSPVFLTLSSTPLPTSQLISTPILTSEPRLSDGIVLTDSQAVVDKIRVLCCENGWWDHLSEAEHKYREAKSNGEGFDTGAFFWRA